MEIHFNIYKEDKTLENFGFKNKKYKEYLKLMGIQGFNLYWPNNSYKNISPPAFSVQILTVLPNPPAQVSKEIQGIFYKFLWDGKPDNIKRNVIINNYEEEGLKLPHIQSFCKTLKMSWLQKLLDPMNMSPWKILLLSYIEKNMAEIRYYS